MQLKKLSLALVLAGSLAAHANASEETVESVKFDQADVQVMFEQSDKPMELVALSTQEMKETEGSWFWIYYYAPQITAASYWMYTTGWRTIPVYYNRIKNW